MLEVINIDNEVKKCIGDFQKPYSPFHPVEIQIDSSEFATKIQNDQKQILHEKQKIPSKTNIKPLNEVTEISINDLFTKLITSKKLEEKEIERLIDLFKKSENIISISTILMELNGPIGLTRKENFSILGTVINSFLNSINTSVNLFFKAAMKIANISPEIYFEENRLKVLLTALIKQNSFWDNSEFWISFTDYIIEENELILQKKEKIKNSAENVIERLIHLVNQN